MAEDLTTQEQIHRALKACVAVKPYASVRIQDICDEAHFSRKTFSKWFGGKDDVLLSILRSDFADPIRRVNADLPVHDIASATRIMLDRHYRTFYENRQFYKAVASSMGELWLADHITSVMEELNLEIFARTSWMDSSELDFSAFFISAAHAMILVWWLREGFEAPPEKLVELTEKWLYAHQREIDTAEKRL